MRKTFLFLLVTCVGAGPDQLEFDGRIPKAADLLNRVSNTTFGSVNFVGKAVDKVKNTFGRVEDRVRALLGEFRDIILRRMPGINIPLLDPLHDHKIEVNHEVAQLKTKEAANLTIKHIWKFHVDKKRFNSLGNHRFKLELNLTFPYVKMTGNYKLDFDLGRIFYMFGEGPFRANFIGLKLGTSTIVKFTLPAKLRVESLFIDIKLEKLESNFDNLFNDKESGELINMAFSNIAPDLIDLLWPELRSFVQEEIKQLFTIHGYFNGHYGPLVFCVLPDNATETDKKCFELVTEKCSVAI